MTIHNSTLETESVLAQIPILIPSLHPDENLLRLLNDFRTSTADILHIIVVDDGSGHEYGEIFETAKTEYDCHVLTHHVNQGKGRALKTAFRYALETFPDCIGVVTVDADGQHAVHDVFACMRKLAEQPGHFILGSRSFSGDDVPLKSSFGNKLTNKVLRMASGMAIEDTQTGLRAIPRFFLQTLEHVPGERYEFEMNMLLECSVQRIPITQVPIQTIYLEGNKASHFRPVFDSLKIYAVFLKYLLSALASFLLDIAVFSLLVFVLKGAIPVHYILISTIMARLVSAIFNYVVNKNLVFQAKQGKGTALKYYTLALLQMIASGLLVTYIYAAIPAAGEPLVKVLVDTVLFFLSFYIQRKWVFANQAAK